MMQLHTSRCRVLPGGGSSAGPAAAGGSSSCGTLRSSGSMYSSGGAAAQRISHVTPAYLPGQPRPLSELLSAPHQQHQQHQHHNKPPPSANRPQPAPAAVPAPTPPAPAAPPAPAGGAGAGAAAAAAAAPAGRGGGGSNGGVFMPPLPPAAAAVAAAAARMRPPQAATGYGYPPAPAHQGLGRGLGPKTPAVSPRPPPGGGYYQMATGPGGAPLPLSQGLGQPSDDGWGSLLNPTAAQASAVGSAAAPYKTAAEPYEAFEPGDTGFSAPTTAQVVTSSSGSVMVKFSAHFSGVLGDKVLVCGGCRALGNWEPDAAPSLAWGEGDVWTATLELPPGTHEFKCVAVKADPKAPLVWEPGNNRRAVVARSALSAAAAASMSGASLPTSSGDEIDLVLGLLSDEEPHPEAQLVETAGGTTMVKLTTTYTAAFGEYLKVVGGPTELGAWDAGAAPALTWGEGDVWTATLELPAGEHEFKYVVVRQDGRLEWEPGENRCIHVPPAGLAAALAAAKQAVAAEEAAGGNGRRPLSPPGRRLSPAEIYELQESIEQLEPWQQVSKEHAEQQAAKEMEQRAQHHQVASAAHQQRTELQQQRLAALGGGSASSNGNGKPAPAAAAAAAAAAAGSAEVSGPPASWTKSKSGPQSDWREVHFTTKLKAEFGTYLKAVGGPEQLGAWEVDGAPPLQWNEGDVWSVTLLLPPGTHEFKLVVVNADKTATWETGPNRVLEVQSAANRSSEAAGVLHCECTYGQTDATSSLWASVEEEETGAGVAGVLVGETDAARRARTTVPESWYSERQRSDASAAAAAAEAQQRAAEEAQQQKQREQEEAAAKKAAAKPLQPLDAVVKVFKERFVPWSSPAASPTASKDEEVEAAAAAAVVEDEEAAAAEVFEEEEEQQQEQEEEERAAVDAGGVGDRFASIIAARKQQQDQQPAVLFMDQQQQQQPWERQQQPWERDQQQQQQGRDGGGYYESSSSDGDDYSPPSSPDSAGSGRFDSYISNRQQQQQPTPPWEQQPVGGEGGDAAAPADRWAGYTSSSRGSRGSIDLPEARAWRPQQQQGDEDGDEGGVSERFASQIQRIRQRSPSPSDAQHERQQQQQRGWEEPDEPAARWERQQHQQQQQQEEQQSPRWQREQPQQEQEQEQPAARQQPKQQQRRRSGAWMRNWRTGDAASPPSSSSYDEPAVAAADSAAASTTRQQPKQQPVRRRSGSWMTNWRTASPQPSANAGSGYESAEQQQQQSAEAAADDRWQQQQKQQKQQRPPRRRSSAWMTNWRTESPEPSPPAAAGDEQQQEQEQQQQAAAADRWQQQKQQRPARRRSGAWMTNWRSASPEPSPSAAAGDEQQQQGQEQPAVSRQQEEQQPARRKQQQQRRRSGAWMTNWRTESPEPQLQQVQEEEQGQESRPSAAAAGYSWRSRDSDSSASSSWDSSDEAAETEAPSTSSYVADSSSSGGRFSKFASGNNNWRSSSSGSPAFADDSTASQQRRQQQSSWDAVEAGGGRGGGADYLFELGQSDYNTNVDAGQNRDMIDSLFAGDLLGKKSDIADGSLRGYEFRTYNNIVGDYYIAPHFLDKVSMHITKNYLADQAAISSNVRVPLVLGIWGPKGCGKTFQTELAFKKLGVEPVVMSAGELESEVAGQPGRLIRERYRKAAELSRVRGKLSCLLINDLDAGIGRFGNTQCTVNNQIVIGTLMNICDDPNRVSIGAGWRENDTINRVPIIVTGNDFSTLYAPLIRDGRMEKFYWEPQREEVVNIVWQMYKEDGLSKQDIETLVATFGNQALDFFGALRAATYDGQIRDWMLDVAGAPLQDAEEARVKEMNKRLLQQKNLPEFEPVPLTLAMLVQEGMRLVKEQQLVNNNRLGEEYMRGVAWGDVDTSGGSGGWSNKGGGGGLSLLG